MPGVPPDAFAQVKKGLRGLFGRKKKHKDQPTPTTGAPSGSDSTAAPGATSSVPEPTKTEPAQPSPPQPSNTVSPPATDANASESTPAAPKPSEPELPIPPPKGAQDVNQKPEDLPSSAKTLTPDAPPPPAPTGEPGMSATSGPLDDQMAHEYAHLGKDEEPPAIKKGEDVGAAAAEQVKKVEGGVLKT